MTVFNGKYATAKVFTDVVDEESISQLINLANQEFVANSQIRMMPDIHAGAGCTIGTTMTIKDKVVPNLVRWYYRKHLNRFIEKFFGIKLNTY